MTMLMKQKKTLPVKGNRFLITVTVVGSAGPIRFVVNEDDLVFSVIDTALKSYAREGRLPILGTDRESFMLYCPVTGTNALNPWETIGALGVRNFMLCKKPEVENVDRVMKTSPSIPRRGATWKAWLNKSLSFKLNKVVEAS